MKAKEETAPTSKPAKKHGAAALVYDVDDPDSLISPKQFAQRQDRLAKFQRRAAHPNVRPEYRHAERVSIIDRMLALSVKPIYVDLIVAALNLAWYSDQGQQRLKRALAVLTGGELTERREADPPPDADAETVDRYLSRLSRKEDQFADAWDDADQCYYISVRGGASWCGVDVGDEMAAKQKTPEPGDLIIVPTGGGRFYLGYYVAGDSEFISLQTKDGLGKARAGTPPLVVTRIRRDGSDV